ncbi:cell division FtsA domain-containing protein, partial [Candidatus Parcubacteria bacterium]|nr:cell division FtsA domain-containing protein [Candidatus Parcubacteria bacterium]
HLKKIGRNGLLPAGVIITGGGSSIGPIETFAKTSLRLPARIATINAGENGKAQIKDSTWAVAYGLCIFGQTSDQTGGLQVGRLANQAKRSVVNFVKQFLP